MTKDIRNIEPKVVWNHFADLNAVPRPSKKEEKVIQFMVDFGKKLNGYLTNDAVLHATETRTSSPVRIPRDEKLEHPDISGFYPCGEGAGYAGGIVSAAIDGMKCTEAIANKHKII